jgi:hypothetical protein
LRRFYRHLAQGRLSRRIEKSPLPFGRHRWVAPGRAQDIEIVPIPRPRAEFETWLRDQGNTPLDSEHGPGWHLAVLPFTDGGAGVSLVISHCLTDGGGLALALADATAGRDDEISWPAAGSRRRWRALLQDLRQFLRDIPAIGRAVGAAARFGRRTRGTGVSAIAPPGPFTGTDGPITIPMATTLVDIDEWDRRARSVGATSNTLLVGVATRLAQRVGRVVADGSVELTMPVNDRHPGDTRANAITSVDFRIDPPAATTDLGELRAAIKRALIRHQDMPNERWELLPLAPLLPKWLVRRMAGMGSGSTSSVVSSNVGDIDQAVNRADGTDADYFAIRTFGPGMTKATMHRIGGMLVVVSGRINGKIFISVLSYQLNQPNSDEILRQTLSDTFDDFALTPSQNRRVSTMRRSA